MVLKKFPDHFNKNIARVAYNNWRPKFHYDEETRIMEATTIEGFYLKTYFGIGLQNFLGMRIWY